MNLHVRMNYQGLPPAEFMIISSTMSLPDLPLIDSIVTPEPRPKFAKSNMKRLVPRNCLLCSCSLRKLWAEGCFPTVSQLYELRFLEEELLKLARNGQNQRVQTQLRTCRKLFQWMVDSLILQFSAGRSLKFQHLVWKDWCKEAAYCATAA